MKNFPNLQKVNFIHIFGRSWAYNRTKQYVLSGKFGICLWKDKVDRLLLGFHNRMEKKMRKKAALHNLGCKVNAYELDAMQQMLEANGYEIVPFAEGADVYIINTCTVTNIADRKSRQMLHKAKKMNPQAVVVATGCYVQAAGETLKTDEAIDIVIGNNKKQNLIEILDAHWDRVEETAYHVIDINHTNEYEELKIDKTAEHTRAYIKIQDGCNQFCTYCIIPFARGRVRSRSLTDVMNELEALAKAGYQEIVLTGIHLSSFGVDFDTFEKSEDYPYGTALIELIEKIEQIEGIQRVRLGSLEPRIVTDAFIKRLSVCKKICPHFHLSMQSGCDDTLKRMNRRYDTKQFKEGCAVLRKYFEQPALTTDIIVGFPGETQEEFEATAAYVEEIGFYETHVFKYSRRKGTKADLMPNQIPDQIKGTRSQRLIALGAKAKAAYAQSFDKKPVEVLFEEKIKENGVEYWQGHTRHYVRALAKCEEDLTNVLKVCMVDAVDDSGTIFCKCH